MAEVSPGGGVMVRRFNYRGEELGALRGYALYRAPVGRVDGALFPFARDGRCSLSTGLGLRGGYERMAPINSQLADRELGTQAWSYQLDLVLRVVRGQLTVQPALGYLARRYHVDGDVVPGVDYRALGGGLDVSLRGRYLRFMIGARAWQMLNVGALKSATWFPQQSSYAMSAQAQVGIAAATWIDIVAGGSAEYESFTFTVDRSVPNPNGIATGAYDLYLQGTVSVRFRLGSPAARAPAPAPAITTRP